MEKREKKKPIRLPRKLKKDIIKASGRENYYRIVFLMTLGYVKTGNQYIKIKRGNG